MWLKQLLEIALDETNKNKSKKKIWGEKWKKKTKNSKIISKYKSVLIIKIYDK